MKKIFLTSIFALSTITVASADIGSPLYRPKKGTFTSETEIQSKIAGELVDMAGNSDNPHSILNQSFSYGITDNFSLGVMGSLDYSKGKYTDSFDDKHLFFDTFGLKIDGRIINDENFKADVYLSGKQIYYIDGPEKNLDTYFYEVKTGFKLGYSIEGLKIVADASFSYIRDDLPEVVAVPDLLVYNVGTVGLTIDYSINKHFSVYLNGNYERDLNLIDFPVVFAIENPIFVKIGTRYNINESMFVGLEVFKGYKTGEQRIPTHIIKLPYEGKLRFGFEF